MSLTKDFKLTIMARAMKDDCFGEALIAEAVSELTSGDPCVGEAILRDYINAKTT